MNWPKQAADAAVAMLDGVAAAVDGDDDGCGDGERVARGTRPGSVTTRTTPVMVVVAAQRAAKRECAPTSRPSSLTRARCGTDLGLTRPSMARVMAHPKCHRWGARALTCLTVHN